MASSLNSTRIAIWTLLTRLPARRGNGITAHMRAPRHRMSQCLARPLISSATDMTQCSIASPLLYRIWLTALSIPCAFSTRKVASSSIWTIWRTLSLSKSLLLILRRVVALYWASRRRQERRLRNMKSCPGVSAESSTALLFCCKEEKQFIVYSNK